MVARAPLRTLYQPQRSNDNILIWGGDMEASTVTTVGLFSGPYQSPRGLSLIVDTTPYRAMIHVSSPLPAKLLLPLGSKGGAQRGIKMRI